MRGQILQKFVASSKEFEFFSKNNKKMLKGLDNRGVILSMFYVTSLNPSFLPLK